MENIIIRETSSEMRAIARKALRGNWLMVIAAVALNYFLISTLPILIDELIPGAVYNYYNESLGETVPLPIVSTLYSIFLIGPLNVGFASFFIFFFRRRELHMGHLFDGFEHFFKAVILVIEIGFYVFMWSLLFIIPGIIAAFRYSQAFYILADHPEISVGDCIRLSKHYMKGNKGKYFAFSLSYFGWILLSAIPYMLCPDLNGVWFILADFVFSAPSFFVLAYMETGLVVFYELLSGNLMAKPEEPVNPHISAVPNLVDEQPKQDDEFDF